MGFIKVNNYSKGKHGEHQNNIDPSERTHNTTIINPHLPKPGMPGYVPAKLRYYHSMLNIIL